LRFRAARRGQAYRAAYHKPRPLVSICIPTFNRAELLLERAVASSLGQSYDNVEVIVVGDACTDDTPRLMGQIADSRLRFVNRTQRGEYPADPQLRWLVAGADPLNQAFSLANGDFITQLDDDDMHTPDRVEKLVEMARQTQADLIFHPFESEQTDGSWRTHTANSFQLGNVTSSSILFHRQLLEYKVDKASSIHFREPADWNRLRKFRYLGAKIVRHPDVMLRHFREQAQYGK
jgi:glycosyltransferase involved in cell wall biosynthesis